MILDSTSHQWTSLTLLPLPSWVCGMRFKFIPKSLCNERRRPINLLGRINQRLDHKRLIVYCQVDTYLPLFYCSTAIKCKTGLNKVSLTALNNRTTKRPIRYRDEELLAASPEANNISPRFISSQKYGSVLSSSYTRLVGILLITSSKSLRHPGDR